MSNQPSQVCKENLINPDLTGVYSVFDSKLKKFFPPFLCATESEAVRQFTNLINYSDSLVCKFPYDYTLYKLADFDVSVGEFFPLDLNGKSFFAQVICLGTDVIKKDTIKYRKLKEQIQTVQSQVGSMISDFEKAKTSLDDHIRSYMRLKEEHPYATVDINLNDKTQRNGSPELFPVPPKQQPQKRSFVSKIIDNLFS